MRYEPDDERVEKFMAPDTADPCPECGAPAVGHVFFYAPRPRLSVCVRGHRWRKGGTVTTTVTTP